jgi:predicted dehydrogenase
MPVDRIRLGVLGCATVVDYAILQPWRNGADIVVAAIAARDGTRARAFAEQHNIAQAFHGYDALLRSADVDAIYIALPNALHGRWSIAALEAGFPVLCEKPLASNADEADTMAQTAERVGLPLVEAMHWRLHPVAARIAQAISTLGTLRSMEFQFSLPGEMLSPDNIRFDERLAGGWLMDQGCYCISLARLICGEPEAVFDVVATERSPGLDGGMDARLRFSGNVECRIAGSMIDTDVREMIVWARFSGDYGELIVTNPFLPGATPFPGEQGARLSIAYSDGSRLEERADLVSSWFCQANAFARLVRSWTPGFSAARDAVANMRVVDAIYRAAGMQPRTAVDAGGE